MDANHTIHTNLYGTRAFEIIDASRRYIRDRYSRRASRQVSQFRVELAMDHEVVFITNAHIDYGTRVRKFQSDQEFRVWFAYQMKFACQKIMRSRKFDTTPKWKRNDNTDMSCLLNGMFAMNPSNPLLKFGKVSEVYLVYEILMGRATALKHSNKEVIDQIVGEQLDPIRSEMNAQFVAERQRLKDEYLTTTRRLYDEKSEKIRAFSRQLDEEYSRMCKELSAKMDADVAALKEQLFVDDAIIQSVSA